MSATSNPMTRPLSGAIEAANKLFAFITADPHASTVSLECEEFVTTHLPALLEAVECKWIETPESAGWYWHFDGENMRVHFVFPRPGHAYLAVQDEPTGAGKRAFKMTARMGGRWLPIRIPPTPGGGDER